jgi:hypothetical protein
VLEQAQAQVAERRREVIAAGRYRALVLDGVYLHYRRSVSQTARKGVLLVAVGVREGGGFEVLDWRGAEAETTADYEELLTQLWRRGLQAVELIVSDGVSAVRSAAQTVLSGGPAPAVFGPLVPPTRSADAPAGLVPAPQVSPGVLVDLGCRKRNASTGVGTQVLRALAVGSTGYGPEIPEGARSSARLLRLSRTLATSATHYQPGRRLVQTFAPLLESFPRMSERRAQRTGSRLLLTGGRTNAPLGSAMAKEHPKPYLQQKGSPMKAVA